MSLLATLVAAAAISTTPDCSKFDDRATEPVRIDAEALLPSNLGASPNPLRPGYRPSFRIGPLDYSGYGIKLRSADPRFQAIGYDASEGLFHPCGYRVEGASPWDVRDGKIQASELHFVLIRAYQASADARKHPAEEGIQPTLAGFTAGPRWEIYRSTDSFFIGLMYPVGRSGETEIVAFPAISGHIPARRLASVPIHLDALSALPYPHGGALALDLEGRQRDGSLDYFILDLSDGEEDMIAKSFKSSLP